MTVHDDGAGGRYELVEFGTTMGETDVYVLKLKCTKTILQEAANEIRSAAGILMEQIAVRFPELPVLDSFSIFSSSFSRADRRVDCVNGKLTILAGYTLAWVDES